MNHPETFKIGYAKSMFAAIIDHLTKARADPLVRNMHGSGFTSRIDLALGYAKNGLRMLEAGEGADAGMRHRLIGG